MSGSLVFVSISSTSLYSWLTAFALKGYWCVRIFGRTDCPRVAQGWLPCERVCISFTPGSSIKPDVDKLYEHRAVRPAKVAFVQGWYTQYGDRVEIVPLDLTSGDYTTVLKGNVRLLSKHPFTDRWLQVSIRSFTQQHLSPDALRPIRKPSMSVQALWTHFRILT